ncbi:MAG: hypothetical protein EOS18_16485 [Mesorhizobium sp.]|nr:MAG: hypothetical protein EOS18_16485 [Mesorhizobium sp.]
MPEVTRRTLLAFTAVASVVEPRLVKGKLRTRMQAEASFRMVRECGMLSRIWPAQSANRRCKERCK